MLYNDILSFYEYLSANTVNGKVNGVDAPNKPFHSTQRIYLDVTLSTQANLLDIVMHTDLNDRVYDTMTQSSEMSESRSRNVETAPHGIVDQAMFAFGKYLGRETAYQSYISLLNKFYAFNNDVDLKVIIDYVSSDSATHGEIIDAIREQAKLVLADGKDDSYKMAKVVVRWSVSHPGSLTYYVNQKDEIIKSWCDFVSGNDCRIGMSTLTGNFTKLARTHPKILGAKLISYNDGMDKTCMGIHYDNDTISQWGIEETSKVHSVLRWLNENQSIRTGTTTYLIWSDLGIANVNKILSTQIYDRSSDLFGDDADLFDTGIVESISTGDGAYSQLRNGFNGYKSKFSNTDTIHIIGLNKTSPGRISVVLSNRLNAISYVDKIESWTLDTLAKLSRFNKKSELVHMVCSPTFSEIVEVAFDVRKDNQAKYVSELLNYLLTDKGIPWSYVIGAFHRTIKKKIGDDYNEYINRLSVTCAIIRNHYKRSKHQEIKMSLDINITDRSYLFGRLVAVYEKAIEYSKYKDTNNKNAQTIVTRLFVRMQTRPASTINQIANNATIYINKNAGWLKPTITELWNTIGVDNMNDQALTPLFLCGYEAQREYFFNTKNNEVVTETKVEDDIV